MNILPLGDNIIVRPAERKQILVSDNKSLCLYGEVLAVGKDVNNVEIGDTVIYEMWGLKSPEIDGEKVHFISASSPFLLGKKYFRQRFSLLCFIFGHKYEKYDNVIEFIDKCKRCDKIL